MMTNHYQKRRETKSSRAERTNLLHRLKTKTHSKEQTARRRFRRRKKALYTKVPPHLGRKRHQNKVIIFDHIKNNFFSSLKFI